MKKADTWMPFYVGDYLADTMLLTTLQHGAYLLLMLACWKAGGSLPDDDAALASAAKLAPADWKRCAPALRRFFEARDGQLFHKRISHELERAQNLSDKRTEAGKKGGRPPKQNQEETNRFPDGSAKAKQNETPSPSPNTSSLRSEVRPRKAQAPDRPDDVGEQVWSDWLQLRRTKRAPVTVTVLDGARTEADKAGLSLDEFLRVWCRRGSQGLEAAWLKPDELRPAAAPATFHERQLASKRAEYARITGQQPAASAPPREVIDITPRQEVIPHA